MRVIYHIDQSAKGLAPLVQHLKHLQHQQGVHVSIGMTAASLYEMNGFTDLETYKAVYGDHARIMGERTRDIIFYPAGEETLAAFRTVNERLTRIINKENIDDLLPHMNNMPPQRLQKLKEEIEPHYRSMREHFMENNPDITLPYSMRIDAEPKDDPTQDQARQWNNTLLLAAFRNKIRFSDLRPVFFDRGDDDLVEVLEASVGKPFRFATGKDVHVVLTDDRKSGAVPVIFADDEPIDRDTHEPLHPSLRQLKGSLRQRGTRIVGREWTDAPEEPLSSDMPTSWRYKSYVLTPRDFVTALRQVCHDYRDRMPEARLRPAEAPPASGEPRDEEMEEAMDRMIDWDSPPGQSRVRPPGEWEPKRWSRRCIELLEQVKDQYKSYHADRMMPFAEFVLTAQQDTSRSASI